MTYNVIKEGHVLVPNFRVYNSDGICLFISHDWFTESRTIKRNKGLYESQMEIPSNFLPEGLFSITATISKYIPDCGHFEVNDAIHFQIIDPMDGTTARGDLTADHPGVVRPILPWRTIAI
jgi:hypothetical protein